jgi:hypothetical protein
MCTFSFTKGRSVSGDTDFINNSTSSLKPSSRLLCVFIKYPLKLDTRDLLSSLQTIFYQCCRNTKSIIILHKTITYTVFIIYIYAIQCFHYSSRNLKQRYHILAYIIFIEYDLKINNIIYFITTNI